MRVACLCVTHERPQWLPWVVHQFEKQTYRHKELIIVASGSNEVFLSAYRASAHARVSCHNSSAISPKRSRCLELALETGADAIAWMDDDDWSHPERLEHCVSEMQRTGASIVGHRLSYIVNAKTNRAIRWDSPEPVIFNGALYRMGAVPTGFAPHLMSGEDTEWQLRVFAGNPPVWITPKLLSAWMSHEQNITNRASRLAFDGAHPVPFDQWELEFLGGLRENQYRKRNP